MKIRLCTSVLIKLKTTLRKNNCFWVLLVSFLGFYSTSTKPTMVLRCHSILFLVAQRFCKQKEICVLSLVISRCNFFNISEAKNMTLIWEQPQRSFTRTNSRSPRNSQEKHAKSLELISLNTCVFANYCAIAEFFDARYNNFPLFCSIRNQEICVGLNSFDIIFLFYSITY